MNKLNFSNIKILVVGDVMLDVYFQGKVSRISPEAPVPIVSVKDIKKTLGGAANVAHNITALGGKVSLIGFIGNDSSGKDVKNILNEKNINNLCIQTNFATTTKIRVTGEHQQIVRVDFDPDALRLEKELYNEMKSAIDKNLNLCDLVIISDYNKGVNSAEISQFIIKKAKENSKKVIVDPKGVDWLKYENADLITPNVKELGDICGFEIKNEDLEIEKNGMLICEKYAFNNVLITRSEKGMSMVGKNGIKHIPTKARDVFDVSGAGDTVVALMSLMLAMGKSDIEAMEVANLAAGVVVGKLGTASTSIEELEYAEKSNVKCMPLAGIIDKIKTLRTSGKKIVFTNGCFDILHRGHVEYLKTAKKLGDVLIVGLNADASVKRLKGDSRPVNKEQDRAELLSALSCVDFVVLFEEDTPYNLIKALQPDTLVKGGDYKVEEIIGREFAKETKIITFVDGYSTTKILEKMSLNHE